MGILIAGLKKVFQNKLFECDHIFKIHFNTSQKGGREGEGVGLITRCIFLFTGR